MTVRSEKPTNQEEAVTVFQKDKIRVFPKARAVGMKQRGRI